MAEQRLCSIPDCGKKHLAKGYCRVHYERVKNHGDPHYQQKGERQKFIEDVALAFDGQACLEWPFSFKGSNYNQGGGYPQFGIGRKLRISAHRYICEKAHGAPPTDAHHAAHSCGNSRCVNPKHLEWKTSKANNADKVAHGTILRGEKSPQAKLSEQDVIAIRSLRGCMSQSAIASRFGVTQSYVSEIQRGAKWSHLQDKARP